MFRKNKIKILAVVFISLLLGGVSLNSVLAKPEIGIHYAENLNLTNAAEDDPRDMMVTILKYLITFLGLVSVSVILYGGFVWMTAAGNDDRLSKAKGIITAGIIGLMIILVAFAIVNFVSTMTEKALNGDIS